MRKVIIFLLLILAGASTVLGQTPAVDIPLTVSDGAGGSQQLRFGLDPSATDGIDAILGESELPPVPPSGLFDARFVGDDIPLSLSLGQGILKDYRLGTALTSGVMIHEIKFQVGTGTSILISWSLPVGVTGRLQDVITGALIDQPMTGSGSYTVTSPGSFSKLKMTITYALSGGGTPPAVTTVAATSVTSNSAQLNGTVNPNGAATTYYFEYGTTASYGTQTSSTSAGSGTTATSVSATVSGLTAGTLYHYRVVATNSVGTSPGSDITFTTAVLAPTVVTSAATSVTASGAQLNGTVNPNGAATTYYFEYGTTTSYGTQTSSTSAGSGTSAASVSATLSGLTAGTLYHYRVVATNSVGTSPGSDITFTTAVLAPTVVTSAATSVTASGAQLNGTVNPNGAATTYYFEYGTTTSYGTQTSSTSAGSGTSAPSVSATLSALTPGTSYHYRVVATNSAGTSRGSDMTFTTAVVAPAAVTLAPTSVTASGSQLNGTVNPNGTGTTYYFEYGTTTSYGTQTSSTSAGSGTSATSVSATLSGLTPGTFYHYRVVAMNSVGTSPGSDMTFTTAVPAPTAVTLAATNVTASGAQLNGTVNPNGAATTYYFEYGTTTSYGTQTSSTSAGSGTSAARVNVTASGLTPGTLYHYRVVAANSAGTSPGSDLTFTTAVLAPTVSTSAATSVTASGAQLNGTVNPNGAATTYYFEYGTTTSYGTQTSSTSAGSGASATSVNATLSALTQATLYHYRVVATNSAGTSQGSDITFTTVLSPTATTVAATNVTTTGAQLNGTVNPNGAATTYYFEYGTTTSYGTQTSTTNGGSGTSAVSVTAPISGLTPFLIYHYRVVASNGFGTALGSDMTFMTALSPTVVTLAATNVAGTSAQMNGTVNPNGGATTYYFEYGTTTGYGTLTSSASAGSGTSATSVNATLSGLMPGTLYHYRVVATNGAGTSPGSDMTFTTTVLAPTAVTLAATSVTAGGSQLNGTINPNGAPTTYYFEYGTTTSYGTQTSSTSAGSGTTATSVSATLNGLVSATLYHYRVVATNSAGTSPGSDITFTTAVLAPTVVTMAATGVTASGSQLNGTVNPNGASTTYYFEYGTTTSYGTQTSSTSAGSGTSATSVSATLSGLVSGTLYHYRVVATNSAGTSPGSDMIFTTLLAPTVVTLTATNIAGTAAQLNGTVNPNGGATTYYFEYGTTTGYGTQTSTASAGSGTSATNVSGSLSNLKSGTLYHYRLVASSSLGKASGNDMTFTAGLQLTAVTSTATNITLTSAQLNGTVSPNGSGATYYFEYGTTTSYGTQTYSSVIGSGNNTTSVNVTVVGLTPGTLYHYRIVATNSLGTFTGSDLTFGTVIAPLVATLNATNLTQTSAQLNGSVNPNGSTATSYFQYGPTASYGMQTISSTTGSGTSAASATGTADGLMPGTLYHCRLVASNSAGTNLGNDMIFTTSVLAPTVVTLAATNVAATTAQLNGTVNPNGATGTYYFEYGITTSYGTQMSSAAAGSGTSAASVTVTLSGLTPATLYHYRVVAKNSGGGSQGSDMTFTTTGLSTIGQFPTVLTLAASNVTSKCAQLSGTVNPNGLNTTYYFEYGASTSYGMQTNNTEAGSGTSSTSVNATVKGLTQNTTYHYCLVAINSSGTSPGSDMTFTTRPLPMVVTLPATNLQATSVQLNGTVDPNGTATTYYFEYGKTTDYGFLLNVGGPDSGTSTIGVSASIGGLIPDIPYHYRLVATNGTDTVCGIDVATAIVTSIGRAAGAIPEAYGLSQNYPNPFNPSTKITFTIPKTSQVILAILDALGRTRAVLINGERLAGTYQAEWNASHCASGIYFYRLQAGEYVETKKMVLTK